MSCIIKLKENMYIEWSKGADSPASEILTKEEVVSILKDQQIYCNAINQYFNVEQILDRLEKNGTTDVSNGVNLEFILEHNNF